MPLLLLVPEVLLGRVVAPDLRWILSAALAGMGVLSILMAREPILGRLGALPLGVSASLTLVGAGLEGGVRGGVLVLLAAGSLGLSVTVFRAPQEH